jgi:hypothetical protein
MCQGGICMLPDRGYCRRRQIIIRTDILPVLFLPFSALSRSGRCVGIQDGDTITVLPGEKNGFGAGSAAYRRLT